MNVSMQMVAVIKSVSIQWVDFSVDVTEGILSSDPESVSVSEVLSPLTVHITN